MKLAALLAFVAALAGCTVSRTPIVLIVVGNTERSTRVMDAVFVEHALRTERQNGWPSVRLSLLRPEEPGQLAAMRDPHVIAVLVLPDAHVRPDGLVRRDDVPVITVDGSASDAGASEARALVRRFEVLARATPRPERDAAR